ncbi:MAG: MFS transporter [Acidobacteria bacterium]|nr:MFS transporter [Acidobacteriota bacterium]MBI3664276.1 MFS transporter [Acidobacteriota bacterium]
MSISHRTKEIREGFQRPFWVANITELFERLSYYGVNAVLAIYLHETLKFSQAQAGDLMGFFGGVVWFLPILGGTLADRFGFRRSLAFAYMIMSVGYFLLGSLSASWMAPLRDALPMYYVVLLILFIPALGPAIVKPCVVGTTARASEENVRSLGYSIYYTLVNIGGAAGPYMASEVHRRFGITHVFTVAAISVFMMFFGVLLLFKEPRNSDEKKVASIAEALKNFLVVVSNGRFMVFLLIFSGYWIVFWQEFIALPLYIRGYVDPNADIEKILITDAAAVIAFQFVVTYLTRKIPTFTALTLGTLISAASWLILAFRPSVLTAVITLVVLALGEMTQSPRYYEYISRLAPSGQQGTYMGFAFLPIAIGFFVGGRLGGRLVQHYGEVAHEPHKVWWVIAGVGFLTTVLMWGYDRVVKPGQEKPQS